MTESLLAVGKTITALGRIILLEASIGAGRDDGRGGFQQRLDAQQWVDDLSEPSYETLSTTFEGRLKELREEYERRLRELTETKDQERETIKGSLEARIKELEETLRRERENL